MNDMIISILLVLIGFFVGIVAVFIINYIRGTHASKKIEKMLEDAKTGVEKIKRDYILEAKEETYKLKNEAEREIKEKKSELKESEERLLSRESSMDRRDQMLQNREIALEEKENILNN